MSRRPRTKVRLNNYICFILEPTILHSLNFNTTITHVTNITRPIKRVAGCVLFHQVHASGLYEAFLVGFYSLRVECAVILCNFMYLLGEQTWANTGLVSSAVIFQQWRTQ